jgi:hypothetical protein
VIENSRLEVLSDVSMLPTDRETRLVFHRPYFPGYEVWLDGKVIPARTEDGLQPSVTLPAGAHRRLKLLYRPRVVVWGGWVAGSALAVCLVTGLWLARERPQQGGLPHD